MRYNNIITTGLTAGLVSIFLIAEPVINLKEGNFHEDSIRPIAVTIPYLDHTPHQEYPLKEPIGREALTVISSVTGNPFYGTYEIVG